MPYIKFSKDSKFDGVNYVSRNWYQVSKRLGDAMVEQYPASSQLVRSIPDEPAPAGDSVGPDLLAEVVPEPEVEVEEEEELILDIDAAKPAVEEALAEIVSDPDVVSVVVGEPVGEDESENEEAEKAKEESEEVEESDESADKEVLEAEGSVEENEAEG